MSSDPLNKKDLSERDICTKLVRATPAIVFVTSDRGANTATAMTFQGMT